MTASQCRTLEEVTLPPGYQSGSKTNITNVTLNISHIFLQYRYKLGNVLLTREGIREHVFFCELYSVTPRNWISLIRDVQKYWFGRLLRSDLPSQSNRRVYDHVARHYIAHIIRVAEHGSYYPFTGADQ